MRNGERRLAEVGGSEFIFVNGSKRQLYHIGRMEVVHSNILWVLENLWTGFIQFTDPGWGMISLTATSRDQFEMYLSEIHPTFTGYFASEHQCWSIVYWLLPQFAQRHSRLILRTLCNALSIHWQQFYPFFSLDIQRLTLFLTFTSIHAILYSPHSLIISLPRFHHSPILES